MGYGLENLEVEHQIARLLVELSRLRTTRSDSALRAWWRRLAGALLEEAEKVWRAFR